MVWYPLVCNNFSIYHNLLHGSSSLITKMVQMKCELKLDFISKTTVIVDFHIWGLFSYDSHTGTAT